MTSMKQLLLENTNRSLLTWVQSERQQKRHIPLAVFKSKAIRVFRDLKTQLDVHHEYDGQLNADRKWFMRFLNRHPVRYDNAAETIVTLAETRGGMTPRYVVRQTDLQFIFDDSGGESSDDDDVIIIEEDDPPAPPNPPPTIKMIPKTTPEVVPVALPILIQPQQTPPPPPPVTPDPPGPRGRPRKVVATARHVQQPKPSTPPPAPPALSTRLSRNAATSAATPPPASTPKTTPRAAAAAAAALKRRTPTVPPLKIKITKAAAPPPREPTPPPPPPPAPRQKKVKMVTRCIQVNMEPVVGKGRVFKNDNITIKRRVTAIQRIKVLKTWIKTQDSCQERLKLTNHYLDQAMALYHTREDQVKAFQEKEAKRQEKRAIEREKKKKLKEEKEFLANIKRDRSPTPPSRVIRVSKQQQGGEPTEDDAMDTNEEASALVQCVMREQGEEYVPPAEQPEVEQRPRITIKRERPDSSVPPTRMVRIKREPRDIPVPETDSDVEFVEEPQPVVPVESVVPPVRIKKEPQLAVRIKKEPGQMAVRVKKEPKDAPTRTVVRVKKEPGTREVVNVKIEGASRVAEVPQDLPQADFGLITAVSGDVPMTMLEGGIVASMEGDGEQETMTIAAVNGDVQLPVENAEQGETQETPTGGISDNAGEQSGDPPTILTPNPEVLVSEPSTAEEALPPTSEDTVMEHSNGPVEAPEASITPSTDEVGADGGIQIAIVESCSLETSKIATPDDASMPEDVPMAEETSISENIPLPEETSMPDDVPMPEETPLPEDIPIPEETSIPEDVPIPDNDSPTLEDVPIQSIEENNNEQEKALNDESPDPQLPVISEITGSIETTPMIDDKVGDENGVEQNMQTEDAAVENDTGTTPTELDEAVSNDEPSAEVPVESEISPEAVVETPTETIAPPAEPIPSPEVVNDSEVDDDDVVEIVERNDVIEIDEDDDPILIDDDEEEEAVAPVQEKSPEKTKAPEKTKSPEKTKAVEKTKSPEKTKAVEKTKSPEKTKAVEIVVEPEVVPEPEINPEPEVIPEPSPEPVAEPQPEPESTEKELDAPSPPQEPSPLPEDSESSPVQEDKEESASSPVQEVNDEEPAARTEGEPEPEETSNIVISSVVTATEEEKEDRTEDVEPEDAELANAPEEEQINGQKEDEPMVESPEELPPGPEESKGDEDVPKVNGEGNTMTTATEVLSNGNGESIEMEHDRRDEDDDQQRHKRIKLDDDEGKGSPIE